MPDKPKSKSSSALRSISKQLNKIASSTSNTDETNPKAAGMIDDVPLNKKVVANSSKSKTSKSSTKKVSPAPTTVIGNTDLKLKVSHNDAGRVVISLSDPDKVLVQVHVDESVLKTRGGVLKKKTKLSTSSKNLKEDKDRPKKKSSTITKSSKKLTTSTKKKSSTISSKKKKEPRDLPDELSSARDKSRSKHGEPTTTSKKKSSTTKNFTTHFSSIMSLASGSGAASQCSDGSDDSTRSPLDLNRTVVPPKTPKTQKGFAPQGNTPSTEPDNLMMDDFATTPTWDKRRQRMMKRQNSKIMMDDAPSTASTISNPMKPRLHDLMDTGTEAKVEETPEELSVFSSPLQQRRLQHRQRRLEKQRTEMGETFRSTRSIRSGSSSHDVTPQPPPLAAGAQGPTARGLDPPSVELDASTNATPASFPPLMPENTKRRNSMTSATSGNRARHLRHVPHDDPDDDDDDSNTSNNAKYQRRIRKTIDKARNTELTNKQSDRLSAFSSGKKNQEDDGMGEQLLGGGGSSVGTSKTGSNLFTKIRDKMSHKRPKQDHQKL